MLEIFLFITICTKREDLPILNKCDLQITTLAVTFSPDAFVYRDTFKLIFLRDLRKINLQFWVKNHSHKYLCDSIHNTCKGPSWSAHKISRNKKYCF